MKIGIVTQPLLNNYGGILQNYALQQVLISLGHHPVTLDFIPGFSGWRGMYWIIRRFLNYFLGRIGDFKEIFAIYQPKRNNINIDGFIHNHLECTPIFWNGYSYSIIEKYKFDAIIVGSDQVWRPRYNPNLKDMYLEFIKHRKIRKISYAASFGTSEFEYSKKMVHEIKPLIRLFDAISVREQSGNKLVDRLGASSISVLDPTLLLGREGFDKLIKRVGSENYLGIYLLDNFENTDYNEIIEKLRINHDCRSIFKMTAGENGVGPIEWLETIRSSKFFLTDSFHGTIFCIMFHIPFLTIINNNRGADRFMSLLKPLNLENRLISSIDDYNKWDDQTIDWDYVDKIISDLREKSLKFLYSSLKIV